MNLPVDYIDANGNHSHLQFKISMIALMKHCAIAGQGLAPVLRELTRAIGTFSRFKDYLNRRQFEQRNRFSEPFPYYYDPTEKAIFSNIVGKGIADFLSKRIDGSLYTLNYEAVMKYHNLPINVGRPDLLAYTPSNVFALEAKGYSDKYVNMRKHKVQAGSGSIPVNYSVACVSYNLYRDIQCNYHDPINENVQYDRAVFAELTRRYYATFREYLRYGRGRYTQVAVPEIEERFYKIDLNDLLEFNTLERRHAISDIKYLLRHSKLYLLLTTRIDEFAEAGLRGDISPFIWDTTKDDIYIDNDRIGLMVE